MNTTHRIINALVLIFICLAFAEARKKREEPPEDDEDELAPQVPYLIQLIGKEMYALINTRKYKFYIYMTIGTLPNEENTIALLSIICNVLYGICVFMGFLILPRGYMLVGTLVTLYIGPAMILILLGCVGGAIAAFAMYPVLSVFAVWVFFFLTSQLAQALGRYLGLDRDKDGDVDLLDFVYWASCTRVGKFLGLPAVYTMLNDASMNHFQQINRRLDEITRSVNEQSFRALAAASQDEKDENHTKQA